MINLRSGLTTVRALQAFQLLRFAGFFITGILLAKSSAGTDTIGIYESLMFLSAATGFFWVSGILNTLLAGYASTEVNSRGKLLYHSFLLLSIFNVILVVVLWIFKEDVFRLTGDGIREYFDLLLIYILLNNPAFISEYVLLLKEKKEALLMYGLFIFTAALVCTVLPFYFGNGLRESMKLLIVLAAVKYAYSLLLLYRSEISVMEMQGIRKQLFLAVPLVTGLLFSGSAEYIDGFIITSHYGSEAFAIFRYGAREFPVSLFMANALSMAMVPAIAGNLNNGTAELKKESKRLMHLLFIPVCILMLLSRWLYPYIFRPEFAASASIFNIFLLLLISRMFFPQTVVMALQQNKILFRISVLELALNVIFSLLLLQYFGMEGVAYGTVIAFFAEKAMLAFYLSKKKGIHPEVYTHLKLWAVYSAILVLTFMISR